MRRASRSDGLCRLQTQTDKLKHDGGPCVESCRASGVFSAASQDTMEWCVSILRQVKVDLRARRSCFLSVALGVFFFIANPPLHIASGKEFSSSSK